MRLHLTLVLTLVVLVAPFCGLVTQEDATGEDGRLPFEIPAAGTSIENVRHERSNEAEASATSRCSPDAPTLGDALERIDDMLDARRRAAAIPGLAAGVVCGDSLVFAAGHGIMAIDDSTPVNPRTPFRIASVTKLFTATAVVMQEEAGALGLDDPVKAHLDWFEIIRPPETGDAPITIRQLLTHTSGLPRDSRLTDFSRGFQPGRAEAVGALPDQRLRSPPGERYAYSNLGYGVLGEVVAETSGLSYAEFLERRIFEPLDMGRTLVHPSPEDHTTRGHGPLRSDGSRTKARFWDLGFATPAGGMASSVVDLARFVRLQLAPYLDAEPALPSADAIRDMHRVQFVMDPSRGGSGLGWAVETSNGQHLVYHGGELPDQTSFLLIDLKAHIGIILLSNAEDVDAGDLAQEVLRRVRRAVVGPGVPVPHPAIPPAPSSQ